jgi:serine phosphatase RsbU (regulator of sigma subunit)
MKTTALKNLELTRKDLKLKKEQIEEKHVAITDSISYAKRLQHAILPTEDSISEYFNNYFIYYQPKDIVSGDFYWLHKNNELLFFAVADCTGHGVPGAMVSVVCNNALNRAVNEFGLLKPNLILDKSKELIIEQMGKGNNDVKDGMDISLCCLNTKTQELIFSGANNPIYIIKKDANSLDEIPADRQSVGKNFINHKFTASKIQLNLGDTLYLFTDGFADQFGGKKQKKYKYINFKKLLLNNTSELLKDQKKAIDEEFNSWKGDLEQIDDICILGIKI